jgi:hypothetical protein
MTAGRQCRNRKPIGCPDCSVALVCYLPRNHQGDCYDWFEGVWWRHKRANEPEPPLWRAPELIRATS